MPDAMVVAKAQRVMQAAGYSAPAVMLLTKVCNALPQAASLKPLWQALRRLRTV